MFTCVSTIKPQFSNVFHLEQFVIQAIHRKNVSIVEQNLDS